MIHTVSLSDFVDLAFDDRDIINTFKHEIASSTGKGSRKSLKVVVDILKQTVLFEVTDGLTIVKAYTLKHAIELYNMLP